MVSILGSRYSQVCRAVAISPGLPHDIDIMLVNGLESY